MTKSVLGFPENRTNRTCVYISISISFLFLSVSSIAISSVYQYIYINAISVSSISISIPVSISISYISISLYYPYLYLYLELKELIHGLVGDGKSKFCKAGQQAGSSGADIAILSPEAAWRQNSFPRARGCVKPLTRILFAPVSSLGGGDEAHCPVLHVEGVMARREPARVFIWLGREESPSGQ